MKSRLEPRPPASGTLAGTLFALCAAFVALQLAATAWATRELFHGAAVSAPVVAWPGVVAGLLIWFVAAAVTALAVAAAYGRWAEASRRGAS